MVSMRLVRGALVVGAGLLAPGGLLAQGGGAGAGMGGGAPVAGMNTPHGVDEKDELRGFHRAMALQATSEQTAEFRAVMNKAETAARALDELVKSLESGSSGTKADEWGAHVRPALDAARTETGKFVGGFSLAQKTGLKEITAKLMKAESELGEQEKTFENGAGEDAGRMAGRAEGLRKALVNFRSEQDNLAVEMGMVVSEGAQAVAFTIPARKSTVTIGGQTVGITTSAVVTRASVAGEYRVETTTELADLQENFGAILSATMNREDHCGERITVKEAELTPLLPAGAAMARLHYERWVCSRGYGGTREMAEGNATVQMKVTAGMGADGQLQFSTEIVQVEAEKFFADLLKSGALGAELRDKTSSAVRTAAANFKTALPAAAGDAAAARSVRFESPREAELSVVVGGEMRMTEEQAKAFGEQLKERAGASARKQ